jgi:hypothetical protein
MVPSPNNFGFEARVCPVGYLWRSQKQLGVKRLISQSGRDGAEMATSDGPFLVPNVQTGAVREPPVVRRPGDNPGLFREFAELDTANPGAMLAFANEHGPLGCPITAVCSSITLNELEDSFSVWESRLHAVHPTPTTTRQKDMSGLSRRVETYTAWVVCIAQLRIAVTILDAIRGRDVKRLRQLFRWQPLPVMFGPGSGAWHIDTHPDLPAEEQPSDRINGIVFGDHLRDEYEPIENVALAYLVLVVNRELEFRVNPTLLIDSGKVVEKLLPATLFTAMCAQLFTAISQGKEHRKCPACGNWFELGGPEGITVRRVYCSNACRVRACKVRRDRAEQLAGEGLKPAVIVERMKGEGHETDVEQVRKWIKNTNKRN